MFEKRLLVLNRYVSLFGGRAECVLRDCLLCLIFVHFTNDGGSTSDCSADLVCCSLLLKSDVVVGTLNSCVVCVHYSSTIWVYAMWMTCWHWQTVLVVHLVMVICTVILHFIDLSVRLTAVDVKPVVYYNSLFLSNRVIITHRTHSLNNKRQYDTFIKW